MGMAFLASGAGGEPAGFEFSACVSHVEDAAGEIRSFLNDRSPGGPKIRCGFQLRKQPGKSFQVLPVENGVQFLFHIVRVGSALGINIEHHKGIIAVMQGDPLGRFQGVVQTVRYRRGWIDPDADQRVISPGAEDIAVFAVMIRNIEPATAVKI